MNGEFIERLRRMGVEVVEKSAEAWEDVTKARRSGENSAVDAVIEFLCYEEGWISHDENENLVRHPTKHPMWTTLGLALDFEMSQPDPLPDPVPRQGVPPPPPPA